MGATQHEITSAGPLHDDHGRLREAGWSRQPLLDYDRKRIKAGPHRIKEWDYYLIQDDEFALAMTIDDNGYMGQQSASWIDLGQRTQQTTAVMNAFPLGRMAMPPDSRQGTTRFASKRVEMSFEVLGERRRLQCRFARFRGGDELSVDVELFDEPRDSMTIAIPFAGAPRAFYYNRKIIGMRAEGTVRLGEFEHEFRPDGPRAAFGLLDWGRGVWTYDNTWYWGAASGLVDGRVVGFNIGEGFGDTSAATENIVFVDGVGHKLSEVHFGIPGGGHRAPDFVKPWRFWSDDGRFELDFAPVIDRAAKVDVGPLGSDQHQVFGHFSGTVVLDDGQRLRLDRLPGFAEKVANRW